MILYYYRKQHLQTKAHLQIDFYSNKIRIIFPNRNKKHIEHDDFFVNHKNQSQMLSNEITNKRNIRQSRYRKFMNSQEKTGGDHELDQKKLIES